MSYRFEDYLSDTVGAGTEVELLDCLNKALTHHGYEKIVFSIFNDPDIPSASCHFGYTNMRSMSGTAFILNKAITTSTP